MISWYWLIVAFYGGLAAGIFVTCMCCSAKRADENREMGEDYVRQNHEEDRVSPAVQPHQTIPGEPGL